MLAERTEHTIWAEKYRPDTLEGYIGNESMKAKFAKYIAEGDIPHILLYGSAGTGKTTAAKILIGNIECDSKIINASDDNNIETVRTVIRNFASTASFAPIKIMVLDEFDGFTRQGQEALRNLMEQYSMNCRFILTANYKQRVIDPIVSRSTTFEVVPPSMKDVAVHLASVLKQEGVGYKSQAIKSIVEAYFPDIRKIFNEAQGATQDSSAGLVLSVDAESLASADFKLGILNELKTPSDDSLANVRQLLADASIRDYAPVYRYLFDHVTEYAGNNVSGAILAIAEGQYKDGQVPDKEINMCTTFINLLAAIV